MSSLKEYGLQPANVFRYFEEISAIPHGSRNTKAISDYLVEFAKAHNLEHYQDEANNVIIIKEATEGYEQADPIIIQGHMDMVCEKESDCTIDFEKDGLDLYVDGDFLKAHGTTLGGDDGIAVAYALAIMDANDLCHPRLEVIITVDEEIGMLGADVIDLSMLKGHKMLNIDSDVEGHFLTSCAGGMHIESSLPVAYEEASGMLYTVTVTGLEGGHSGAEIDKEHGNANIIMGRVLKTLADSVEYGIVSLAGGLKDNAIPRECKAELLVDSADIATLEEILESLKPILANEFMASDKDVTIIYEANGEQTKAVLTVPAQTKVLFYLRNVPNGVQHMSRIMPGLVETSLNLGIMELKEDCLYMMTSIRSCVSSRKADLADKLVYLTEFLGGEVNVGGDYPAWEYKADSAIRETISAVYKELFNEEPVFEAIHAGLECGILSGKIENLDCVSFGPNNYDIHTPKERLSISSTEKVWKLLVEFLKRSK